MPRLPEWAARQLSLIQDAMRAIGIPQSELARRLGVSPSNLSHIKAGRHRMSEGMRERIMLLMNVSAAERRISTGGFQPGTGTEHSLGMSIVEYVEHISTCAECIANSYYMRAPVLTASRTPVRAPQAVPAYPHVRYGEVEDL